MILLIGLNLIILEHFLLNKHKSSQGAWGYRVRYKQTTQGWGAWTYDTWLLANHERN